MKILIGLSIIYFIILELFNLYSILHIEKIATRIDESLYNLENKINYIKVPIVDIDKIGDKVKVLGQKDERGK